MSRSIKKNMGGSCVCFSSDKESRTIYHRSFRRKCKKLCRDVQKNFSIEQIIESSDFLPTDDIVESVDFSCTYADKWCWASDGGTYIMETPSSLIKKFDKELFGIKVDYFHRIFNSWELYQKEFLEKQHCDYDFISLVINHNLPKTQFLTSDEFVNWFRENQNRLISTWKKLNYGK